MHIKIHITYIVPFFAILVNIQYAEVCVQRGKYNDEFEQSTLFTQVVLIILSKPLVKISVEQTKPTIYIINPRRAFVNTNRGFMCVFTLRLR